MNKKTKKALLAALACSAVLAGAVGLAACTPGEEGGESGHKHSWGDWTVATEPKNGTEGKATRTCSGTGDCDAAKNDKEATLPVLTSTDYTKQTTTTATCKTDGVVTYTYNKNGVNVSFDVTTGKDANNHEDGCEHAHKHVWSEWEVEEGNEPSTEAPGKATRTCSGDDCNATAKDKEMTLPKIEKGVYETEVKTELSCVADGEVEYTYTVGEGADQVKITFTLTTPSEGEDSHTYDENVWKYDSEGHFHLCNGHMHEIDRREHDTNGENGECSVCDYFGSLTWSVDFGAETTATLENAYVTDSNVWRTIVITGLTSNHQYTITSNSIEDVNFKFGFAGGGASYSFLYKEYDGQPEEEKCATVNFNTTGEARKVTLIITDEGEIVNEPEDITEIATEQEVNFTDVDDAVFYKLTVEQEGSYYLVISFNDELYSDTDFLITIGSALTNEDGEFIIDHYDLIATNFDNGSFYLDEGTYYVMLESNAMNMSTYECDPVSGSFKITTEGSDESDEPIELTPSGWFGNVPGTDDGVEISLSGFEVGKTYSISVMKNGDNYSGVYITNEEGGMVVTFTYVEGMKLYANSFMGDNDIFFVVSEGEVTEE